MPAYMVHFPSGDAESFLAQDDPLTLTIEGGWAVLTDAGGPCLAFSSTSGATITRVDDQEDTQPKE